MKELTVAEAILEATDQLLASDPNVYVMGLGVCDPKGVFGTTIGLQQKYGEDRVLDMPISENAMTGVAIGSAIMGHRPIMTHQRVDFFLLAFDQLINNAAKWRFMFAEKKKISLVIRLIIGKGWGQGPQHSQTLHSVFAHIPGLKVVAPSNALDAKGLLISSVYEEDPVIFLEHRWTHAIKGKVPSSLYKTPLGKAEVIREGKDITVVASSHMTLEALQAISYLPEEVSVELIDLKTLKPFDFETVQESLKKTGRILVLDGDWKTCGFAAEVIAQVAESGVFLKSPPQRITFPDAHQGTSWSLSNDFYPSSEDIAAIILSALHKTKLSESMLKKLWEKKKKVPLDTPYSSFAGPF